MKTLPFLLLLPFVFSCEPPFISSNGESAVPLPRDFSWGAVDLDNDGISENYLTDTKTQLGGNCVIYATVGFLEIQFKIDHLMLSDLNLSEQNIQNCLRFPSGSGVDERRLFYHLQKFGIPEEHFAPTNWWFACHNCIDPLPTMMGLLPMKQVPFYGLTSWNYIVTYAETKELSYEEKKTRIMEALQYGPVMVDSHSWPGFVTDPITNLTYCGKPIPGGHETLVVGYENNGEIFLIKNSYAEGKILRVLFDGAERCGLFHAAVQISGTFVKPGLGKGFCSDSMDDDDDQVPTAIDNCPWKRNTRQTNKDNDLLGDVCDECPNDFNLFNGFYCAK